MIVSTGLIVSGIAAAISVTVMVVVFVRMWQSLPPENLTVRIRKIPGYGFSPEVYSKEYKSWVIIQRDYSRGIIAASVLSLPDEICDTMDEAGLRVNEFCDLNQYGCERYSESVVWVA